MIIKNEIPLFEYDDGSVEVIAPNHDCKGLKLPEKCLFASLIYVGSRGCISSYENDARQISVDTLVGYSKVFQVTTDWIVKGMDKDTGEIERIYYGLGNSKLQKIALEQMRSLSKLYL